MNVEVECSDHKKNRDRTVIYNHINRKSEAIPYFDIRHSLFDNRYSKCIEIL